MTTTPSTIDLRGVRCPLPIVRLNNELKKLAPGAALAFVADDPAFRLDVEAWARRLGLQLTLADAEAPTVRGTVCRP
ncbi:MAG: sulfurtransferase TusA family protein [Vicinamibacterales bacterium]